jgi:hypothetical protein
VRAAVPLVALAVGCAAKRAEKREGAYALGEPGEGWQRVEAGGADHAWYHPALGASLYSDANCGRRFEDRPLPDLARSLLSGIATEAPGPGRSLEIDGREAWQATVAGRLDGVAVQLAVGVLKKDGCTYDVVYVALPERFDAGLPAFDAVFGGIRTGR